MLISIKNILNSAYKKKIIKGSIEAITLKVLGILIGYAFVVILSRNYGAEAVGIYQISIQFIGLITSIALLGFNQSIIRFTAEFITNNCILELKRLLKTFSQVSFLFATFIAVLVFFFSQELAVLFFKDEALSQIFQVLSLILPFSTLNTLYLEFLRGLQNIKLSEFLRLFLTKILNLIIFFICIYSVGFNYFVPVLSYQIALFFTFLISLYFAIKYLNKKTSLSSNKKVKKRGYILTSFTMYQSILLMILSSQVLTFMLAYYTTPSEVGIYSVALQISLLSSFVFGAISTATAPRFSALYFKNSVEFTKTLNLCKKIIFFSTGILAVFTIIFSKWLMSIFGEEFLSGSDVLIVLSLGNFINALTGPGGVLLDMIGKQGIRRNILIINTICTVCLALILIPKLGSIGLAYTTLCNMTIGNLICVFYSRRYLGVNLIYFPFMEKIH